MSKTTKYCLQILGANLLLLILLCIPFAFITNGQYAGLGWLVTAFIIFCAGLFVQLLVGLGYAMGTTNREFGKAMLLSVGIIFLIGFSICSTMLL